MLFTTLTFVAVFLPMVLLIYYTLLRGRRRAQNFFLLIASLLFYAWGEPWFVFVLIASVLFNWIFGLLVEANRHSLARLRFFLGWMLILNLSIIFVFKYLNFSLSNLNRLPWFHFPSLDIVLPIGISFFTFQAISYVVDVYRGHGRVQSNPLNVGLYISFFPQLIAGPIVRYRTVAEQIDDRKETFEDFSQGVMRFLAGFTKKVILANNLATVADKAFAFHGEGISVAFAWMGAVAYTLQIYYDFSGYSDMAIGLGKMFGFHFLENFNYPYVARSVTEFWRRWHMSLQTWFRDYVYIPMGGSRVESNIRRIFNLLAVWFLTGLWHGANWTFIFWGLMYFLILVFEKQVQLDQRPVRHLATGILRQGYTLILVMLGWVFFRSESLGGALRYLKTLFALDGSPWLDQYAQGFWPEYWIFFVFGMIFSAPIVPRIIQVLDPAQETRRGAGWASLRMGYGLLSLALFVVSLAYLVKGSYNPFIYFNF